MKYKYMLITVIDREIMTEKCIDLKDAQRKMREELEKYADLERDEYEIDEMEAWANVNHGDMDCDWSIVEIND